MCSSNTEELKRVFCTSGRHPNYDKGQNEIICTKYHGPVGKGINVGDLNGLLSGEFRVLIEWITSRKGIWKGI